MSVYLLYILIPSFLYLNSTLFTIVLLYITFASLAVRYLPLNRKDKRIKFKTNVIGHRGGALIAQENSILAFKRALEEGKVDMLELDVCESVDHIPVVSHDPTLERTADLEHLASISEYHHLKSREYNNNNNKDNNNNNNKREGDQKGIDTPMPSVVSDLYAADPEMLPLISNNIQLDYPSRQYRSYSRLEDPIVSQHPQQRYCTLEEVFKQFPGVPIHIDIKVMKRSLVDSTLALIEKYNRVDITIVGSGHNPASQWVKDYMDVCNIKENLKENTNGQKNISKPHNSSDKTLNANSSKKVRRYLTCGNTTDVYMIYFCYYIGILPWVPLDIDAFDIPLITTFVNEYEIESKSFFKVIKTKFLFWMLTAPNLWKLLQRRGVVVLGFVINDEKCWEEVRDWPINGVMTDDPIRLRKYIEDRDKHHPKNSNLDGDYPRW